MRFIRIGVCLLLTLSVLAHGAVEVWSESVLEIGAAVLFLIWGIMIVSNSELNIHWTALHWPVLAFLGFGLVQYAFHWTVYPYLTRVELLKLAALFLLFFLTTQAFRERRELRAFIWFLMFLGFAVALFAIAQNFTSNGKLYWFREVTGGTVFGPYVNRNHFAGLMELIIPIGLSLLLLRGVHADQVPLAGLFTIVPVGALFLSASRGGISTFIFQLGLLTFLTWRRPAGRIRLLAAALALLAAGGLVAWMGVGQVVERFSEIRPGEVSSNRRLSMIKGSWRVFLDHPWSGTGLGTLIVAYPPHETLYDGRVVDHAHNDYVETLADMGLPGALCGLAFLALLWTGSLARLQAEQSSFSLAMHVGALVACAGLLVHSFVDFNFHIPSNALLFLLQANVATSPPLPRENFHRVRQSAQRISVVDSAALPGS